MNENIENIVSYSMEQKPSDVSNSVEQELSNRILNNLEVIKDHIASTMFDISKINRETDKDE